MDGYTASTYGDAFADVYDDWYADVSPPEATAAFLAARTDGPVLELGSGTGRLVGPMIAAGLEVIGLDASTAMLQRSQSALPGVPVVCADMTEPPIRAGSVGAVLVAFNTLFNLESTADQRRALTAARRVVAADGLVVVEAFVPGDQNGDDHPDPAARDHVDLVRLDTDAVVLRVSRTDIEGQRVHGAHIEFRDQAAVRVRPWSVRYSTPAQLDALAATAGLEVAERFADWEGSSFDAEATGHVTVYRPKANRR